MTKVYCDLCGTVIEAKDRASAELEYKINPEYSGNPEVKTKELCFRITYAINGTWNSGDICLECLATFVPRAISKRIREQNAVRG